MNDDVKKGRRRTMAKRTMARRRTTMARRRKRRKMRGRGGDEVWPEERIKGIVSDEKY